MKWQNDIFCIKMQNYRVIIVKVKIRALALVQYDKIIDVFVVVMGIILHLRRSDKDFAG